VEQSQAVPALTTESAQEERRMREAELRRRNRLSEREQILAGRNDTEESRTEIH
jgi:hypothetical protein